MLLARFASNNALTIQIAERDIVSREGEDVCVYQIS